MTFKFEITLKSVRESWRGSKGELNEIFRQSLLAMAGHWINTMLPRHFENEAVMRYGYRFRSKRFLALKKGMRPELTMPAPFQFKGELMKYVMGNARSGQMLNASKPISTSPSKKNTSGKLRITVPVRIPHPINPKNAGELTRVTRGEYRECTRVFVAELYRRLSLANKVSTEERITA